MDLYDPALQVSVDVDTMSTITLTITLGFLAIPVSILVAAFFTRWREREREQDRVKVLNALLLHDQGEVAEAIEILEEVVHGAEWMFVWMGLGASVNMRVRIITNMPIFDTEDGYKRGEEQGHERGTGQSKF